MSLKAYDGMMSPKGVKYIQDETIKRIPKFREAAEEQLLRTYARMTVVCVDSKTTAQRMIDIFSHGGCRKTSAELKEIIINHELTMLSLIYQISRIMSHSYFQNDYTVGLHLSMEVKRGRTLVYPSINVRGYREILMEYLVDWYAQNQSDEPPESEVPAKQWKIRCKDWNDFGEVSGYKMKIDLFDPDDFYSVNTTLRGDKLIEGILKNLPPEDVRLKTLAETNLINAEMSQVSEEERKEKGISIYMRKMDYYERDPEGLQKITDYIKDNNLTVTPITRELLLEKGRFAEADDKPIEYVDFEDRQPEL